MGVVSFLGSISGTVLLTCVAVLFLASAGSTFWGLLSGAVAVTGVTALTGVLSAVFGGLGVGAGVSEASLGGLGAG